jgi:putative hydrolase of the HAD superfamily
MRQIRSDRLSAVTNATQPHAILVDLDDTIIDFSSSAEATWRAVCDSAAQEVDGLDATVLFDTIARIREWFWSDPERHRQGRADLRAASRRIVHQALSSLGHDREDLAAIVADTYRDFRNSAIRVFPDAVETLEELRTAGVRLALVTNGAAADQRAKIERFDLARHFEHILIEGEFGCGKPDPRVYRAAMQALRSEPQSTWSVGDNIEWDVAAPQRLGVYAVWIDAARAGVPPRSAVQPQRIIHSLAELLDSAPER